LMCSLQSARMSNSNVFFLPAFNLGY
jgi:hypothetical protein